MVVGRETRTGMRVRIRTLSRETTKAAKAKTKLRVVKEEVKFKAVSSSVVDAIGRSGESGMGCTFVFPTCRECCGGGGISTSPVRRII